MPSYRVVPLPGSIAQAVRTTRRAPVYGHPTHVEIASGYGPCRSCLERFHEGSDRRVLFTYNPFEGLDAYPSPGPVFIHEEPCRPYDAAGFPSGLRDLPLLLEGYARGRWLVAREPIHQGDVESSVERIFAHPAVDYIHVRNAEAGCFVCQLARSTESKIATGGG